MTALKNLSDSLSSESKEPRIVAMGDFNDTPDSPPFRIIEESLINKACDVIGANSGTIRYEGKWELIDMFLVSPEIAGKTVMEIVRVPFHMVRDTGHSGLKPFRTYSGPKYIGGISDHCPVILKLFWKIIDIFEDDNTKLTLYYENQITFDFSAGSPDIILPET